MANYVSKHTGSQIDTAVENVGVLEGKVTTLSEEITQNHEKLSDEIKSLRAGVFDEVTIKSQTVIFKPSEGSPINATSLIASEEGVTQVQLTHSNKNLARFKPAISSNGWTLSFPGLSEARIEGTGIADKFIDIAEYTMRSTQAMLTVTMPAGMTFEYRVNGVWTAYIENGNTAIINGSVGDVISGYFKALSGTTVSGAVTVQLEIGTVATEYVPAVETVYTVDLPHTVYNGSYKWADGTLVDSDTGETVTLTAYTILAHSGTNALWSNAGETSVAYQRPASQGGGGEGGGTYLDYRAFNLEVMYLTGDTMLMNKDNAVVLKIKFKDIDAWAKSNGRAVPVLLTPKRTTPS